MPRDWERFGDAWPHSHGDPDLEGWLRDAGHHLDVSEQLRARTLDGAKRQSRRQTARLIAAVFLVLGSIGFWFGQRQLKQWQVTPLTDGGKASSAFLTRPNDLYLVEPAAGTAAPRDHEQWRLVQALLELKRRQALVLR